MARENVVRTPPKSVLHRQWGHLFHPSPHNGKGKEERKKNPTFPVSPRKAGQLFPTKIWRAFLPLTIKFCNCSCCSACQEAWDQIYNSSLTLCAILYINLLASFLISQSYSSHILPKLGMKCGLWEDTVCINKSHRETGKDELTYASTSKVWRCLSYWGNRVLACLAEGDSSRKLRRDAVALTLPRGILRLRIFIAHVSSPRPLLKIYLINKVHPGSFQPKYVTGKCSHRCMHAHVHACTHTPPITFSPFILFYFPSLCLGTPYMYYIN